MQESKPSELTSEQSKARKVWEARKRESTKPAEGELSHGHSAEIFELPKLEERASVAQSEGTKSPGDNFNAVVKPPGNRTLCEIGLDSARTKGEDPTLGVSSPGGSPEEMREKNRNYTTHGSAFDVFFNSFRDLLNPKGAEARRDRSLVEHFGLQLSFLENELIFLDGKLLTRPGTVESKKASFLDQKLDNLWKFLDDFEGEIAGGGLLTPLSRKKINEDVEYVTDAIQQVDELKDAIRQQDERKERLSKSPV